MPATNIWSGDFIADADDGSEPATYQIKCHSYKGSDAPVWGGLSEQQVRELLPMLQSAFNCGIAVGNQNACKILEKQGDGLTIHQGLFINSDDAQDRVPF